MFIFVLLVVHLRQPGVFFFFLFRSSAVLRFLCRWASLRLSCARPSSLFFVVLLLLDLLLFLLCLSWFYFAVFCCGGEPARESHVRAQMSSIIFVRHPALFWSYFFHFLCSWWRPRLELFFLFPPVFLCVLFVVSYAGAQSACDFRVFIFFFAWSALFDYFFIIRCVHVEVFLVLVFFSLSLESISGREFLSPSIEEP